MLQLNTYIRLLIRIVLVVYFLAAGAFLGVRYWVLPNIDQWRPQLAQQLSSATGMQVQLGQVKANWSGLNPSLQIRDIDFTDPHQRQVLHLPRIRAVLSWRSLFSRSLQFVLLEASGLNLQVRRDANHKLWIMGQSFELDKPDAASDAGADGGLVLWLLRQPHVALTDAVVRWEDATRSSQFLVLDHVNLVFQGASATPSLALRAVPPKGLGEAFELRANVDLGTRDPSSLALQDLQGRLYVRVDKMVPKSWSPWLRIPPGLESGEVSAQWWLAFQHGQAETFTSDINVNHARWSLDATTDVQAESARWYVSGKVSDYARLYAAVFKAPATGEAAGDESAAANTSGGDIDVALQASDLQVRVDDMFAHPMRFDHIALRAGLGLHDDRDLQADVKQLRLLNPDMDLALHGSWRQGGSGAAGVADIAGEFKRASMDAIDQYMPNTVNIDAREWLAKGLVAGQIENARVVLKGDLEKFPWGKEPAEGDFLIAGDYVDGIIDYLPAEGAHRGWPRLTDMHGKVALHRADLRIVADQARIWPTDKAPIVLRDVRAQIPNLEHHSVLTIQGQTAAAAQTYLALAEHSPLGKMLDDQLDEATAQGDWEVPLWLRIPLLNSRDSTVHGAIRFSGGSFKLMPEMPALDDVEGSLLFSDTGVSADGLSANVLGGPAVFSGGVGGNLKGLSVRGQASSDALMNYAGLEGMKRLKGQLPYTLTWRHAKSTGSVFTVDSTLQGMALDFPVPRGKEAGQALPLHVRWARAQTKGRMALDIALGPTIKVRLLHKDGDKKGPYFLAGSLAVDTDASLPASGMDIAVRAPFIDLDAWNDVIDDFSRPLPGSSPPRRRPLLPDVRQAQVQAKQLHLKGLALDAATLTATLPEPGRWRFDIDSSQTTGTVFWNEAQGKTPGSVDARFQRLELGSADKAEVNPDNPDEEAQIPDDALSDIPAVDLQADKLVLYGRLAGSLVLQGVSQERGSLWRLDKLSLDSPAAKISGTGQWRLKGPDRGVVLDARADIGNLGDYMDQLGFSGIVKNGKGTLKGKFTWRNMPWKFDIADLNGQVDASLEAGRFSSVSSRSARLLELLSLQSIRRLATLSVNPANVFKEGFPFDKLYGTLHIQNGTVAVNNYHVDGPAGNISIGGDIDLQHEKLNLQAMVVPNLDMSGATIAAGIAINPIVGLGAFVTQWLLRNPLSKAMAVHYHVSGDWDDPKLDEVSSGPEKAAKAQAPAKAESARPAGKAAGTPSVGDTADSSPAGAAQAAK